MPIFQKPYCAAVRLQSEVEESEEAGKLEAGAFLFAVGGDLSIGGFEAPPPPGVLDRIAPVEAERATARVRDAEAEPPRPTVSRALIRAPEGENQGKGDLGNRVRLQRDVRSPATRTRVDDPGPGRGTAPRRRHPGAPSVAIDVHGGDAAEHHQHDVRNAPTSTPRRSHLKSEEEETRRRPSPDSAHPLTALDPVSTPTTAALRMSRTRCRTTRTSHHPRRRASGRGSGPAACGSARSTSPARWRRLERRVRVPGCRVEREGRGVGHIARRARRRTAVPPQARRPTRPDGSLGLSFADAETSCVGSISLTAPSPERLASS